MANTHFSFKQFLIHQDLCAMKVCTDACLFGAWSAQQMKTYNHGVENILDIGTGTGLLSLMLAQQDIGNIHAIEIDASAIKQARENFTASPWRDRLKGIHGNVIGYHNDILYDFIICNPPFYEGELRSPGRERNAAMHDSELILQQVLKAIKNNLSPGGYASLMLPYSRKRDVEEISIKEGLYCIIRTDIRHTMKHSFFRTFVLLSAIKKDSVINEVITILDDDGVYTNSFSDL
ncbi:MAG: methyltransferase, partial [Ferruginibacter sp.]